MTDIETFDFEETKLEKMRHKNYASNWPAVYILEGSSEFYVGQTVNVYLRSKQHLERPERKRLQKLHLITDDEFNLSATCDIESSLIEFMFAEGKSLQNKNSGLTGHNYYDREKYTIKFEQIWKRLIQKGIVQQELFNLRNKDLFKYSPYKKLTEDQLEIASILTSKIQTESQKTFVVKGGPGTGKSVLAIYLIKYLVDEGKIAPDKIALVVPMSSFRSTLKKVFAKIKNLKASMVIGPGEVVKEKYDLLIVDEAHRLKSRKALGAAEYSAFDNTNKLLGIDNGTQLDWIITQSKNRILFYDEKQSVRPSDLSHTKFKQSEFEILKLTSQLRVLGGNEYIDFIDAMLENRTLSKPDFGKYEFEIFESLEEMVERIKRKDEIECALSKSSGLSRLLAGFAWDWVSVNNPGLYDIEIDNVNLKWNSQTKDWVNSKNAINEVGCIHTIQGYDLNYAGVIIGPELSYDFEKKEFIIYKSKYKDKKGKVSVDDSLLKQYILNIYKVLLTRGIKGTFIYICDSNLKRYFRTSFEKEYSVNYIVPESKFAVSDKTRKLR
jgi:uncharacterized protein